MLKWRPQNEIIAAARKKGVPVIFTVVGYDPHRQADAGLWPEKVPSLRLLTLGSDLVELDPRLDRQDEDLVIVKKYASGFFGTYLASTPDHERGGYTDCHWLYNERLRPGNGDGRTGEWFSPDCTY